MLSQHDRRALAEIEEHLRSSEPELARRFERLAASIPPRRRRIRRAAGLGAAALVIGLLTTAFAVHSAAIALLAVIALAALAAAGVTLCMTPRFKSRP